MTTAPTIPPTAMPLDAAMAILREMDRALSMHLQWLKQLHRSLVCDEPPRAEDKSHDAHCRCDFGRWFYQLDADLLAREPGIAELEQPHRVMHDAAYALLEAHAGHTSVPAEVYENFMNLAMDFKQQMHTYQFHLVQRVCSVDQLTGVWNRNSMAMHLAAEAERARRGRHACAICLLDLDKFKRINDAYGHVAGDHVLQEVAHFIKDNLRSYDSMFRYGGEEFLIFLPNTRIDDAEPLLNRLRERLADTAINLAEHGDIHITASFGVTALEPDDEVGLVIERADHALLCAKSKGRNQVCVWDMAGTNAPVQATGESNC